MNAAAPSSGTSPAVAWLCTVVLALALYVGTWPLVMIKSTSVVSRTFTFPAGSGFPRGSTGIMTGTITGPQASPWVYKLYQPLHRLYRSNAYCRDALLAYWKWWDARLGHRAASIGMNEPPTVPLPERL
jgi:hypothetical protein